MKKRNNLLIYPFVIIIMLLIFSNSCKKDESSNPIITVKDIDNNVYHTVTIGTQVWMVENLKVTHYRNGDPIPNVTDNAIWQNLNYGAYCDYDTTPVNCITYGRLYNWYAVNDSRNIAPTGWHVPTDAEWTILTIYLGGDSIAGGKLKEVGTTHWKSPNTGATNTNGFTALPGGALFVFGTFGGIGYGGEWWSSTDNGSTTTAWYRSLGYDNSNIERSNNHKINGFSVRCLKN